MALSCGLLLPVVSRAQSEVSFTCRLNIVPLTIGASPKPLIGSLEGHHQLTDIDLSDGDRVLRFVTAERILLVELNERSRGTGFNVAGLSCMNNANGTVTEEGETPMPQHIDTGNELRDHARYEAAKAAWIARNPEVYERMISSHGSTDDEK